MIYEFYMDSFRVAPYTVYETRVLLLPNQPPLGRVSRQLRQEVLTLFYESFCFQLRFWAPPSRSKWPPSVISQRFLSSLEPSLLGKIRTLELRFEDSWSRTNHFLINVDLKKPGLIEVEERTNLVLKQDELARFARLEDLLREDVVSKIMERDDKSLRLEDIHAFSAAAMKWAW
jgi:hypothetical protein